MTDIVERLCKPPFGTETSERNLMSAAADEITRLRSALSEAEKERETAMTDRHDEMADRRAELAKANDKARIATDLLSVAIEDYNGALEKAELHSADAKVAWAECENLRAELAQARKALEAVEDWWLKIGMHQFVGAPYAIFAVRDALTDTGRTESEHFSPDFIGISDVMRGRTEGEQASKAELEASAKAIYDAFPYDETGTKPAWVPNGNSLKQEEARRLARAALAERSEG